jgi:hypothetical protein
MSKYTRARRWKGAGTPLATPLKFSAAAAETGTMCL